MCERATAPDPAPQPHDNAAAFELLLQTIDRVAADERDRVTRFQHLICDFLTHDPLWSDQFTAVQSYAQWAERCGGDPRVLSLTALLGRGSTGIDLVGTNAADGRYTAIECKYYSHGSTITRHGIEAFISASSHPELFTQRLLVTTSAHFITEQARQESRSRQPPVMLLTRSELNRSSLDWSQYLQGRIHRPPPRQLRDYQRHAAEAVCAGLRRHERGQLIMARGSGRTFTALRLTEELSGGQGLILFLVPSLSLLSRSLSEWKRQAVRPLTALAVCPGQPLGRAGTEDATDITRPEELPYPAAANAAELTAQLGMLRRRRRGGGGLYAIFATYHSLEVISAAQREHGLDSFDLIICDEAHRTAGSRVHAEDDPLVFTRVHDAEFVRGERRLYMTATPAIYGEAPGQQASGGNITRLCSMDDEQLYGPVFHAFTFNEAVMQGCIADYRVIVLAMSRECLGTDFGQHVSEASERGGLNIDHATKIIGCYRAMAKQELGCGAGPYADPAPMRRAVAFAQTIRPAPIPVEFISSRQFTREFSSAVERLRQAELSHCSSEAQRLAVEHRYTLTCRCEHIDGSMNVLEKELHLRWLCGEPAQGECRILFNARCLNEGADIPYLDAVIFLAPRSSTIDLVQAVGMVMRAAPGKQYGYIVLPIVIPEGPDAAGRLDGSEDLTAVMQVLGALKSLDAGFAAKCDGQLQQLDPEYFSVRVYNSRPSGTPGHAPADDMGAGGGTQVQDDPRSRDDGQIGFAWRSHAAEEQLSALLVRKLSSGSE